MRFAYRPVQYRPLGTYRGYTLVAIFYPSVGGSASARYRIQVQWPVDGQQLDLFTVTAEAAPSEFGSRDHEAVARVLMVEAMAETRRLIDAQDFRPGRDHLVSYRR